MGFIMGLGQSSHSFPGTSTKLEIKIFSKKTFCKKSNTKFIYHADFGIF
jgi:hypothetical protein